MTNEGGTGGNIILVISSVYRGKSLHAGLILYKSEVGMEIIIELSISFFARHSLQAFAKKGITLDTCYPRSNFVGIRNVIAAQYGEGLALYI